MEDIISISIENLEKPQETVETPFVNLVDIPFVNSKTQEIVQIPVASSGKSEAIGENTFIDLKKPKEIIAKIQTENSKEKDKLGLISFTNTEVPKIIVESTDAKSQELEENENKILIVSKGNAVTDLEEPNNIIEKKPVIDARETEEIKEMYFVESRKAEVTTKTPFTDLDDNEKMITTPLACSEEPQEIEETPFMESEGPEDTPKISFVKAEDTKKIIEITLADSEESEKITETSLVNSEDSKHSIDIENPENEDHVIQIATTKSINDAYNDLSQEAVINGSVEHSESNNSTDSDSVRPKVTTIQIYELLPHAELTSNDVESQHCSNSNGSFAESMASSQTKSEAANQQPPEGLNENSNNYHKTENGSQVSSNSVLSLTVIIFY